MIRTISVVLNDDFVLILLSQYQGRVKLLSAAGSAAVLFNGIKESWRLARKILLQFTLLWFLNVFGNTSVTILHLKMAKNLFAAGSAEQLNSPQFTYRRHILCSSLVCASEPSIGAFFEYISTSQASVPKRLWYVIGLIVINHNDAILEYMLKYYELQLVSVFRNTDNPSPLLGDSGLTD